VEDFSRTAVPLNTLSSISGVDIFTSRSIALQAAVADEHHRRDAIVAEHHRLENAPKRLQLEDRLINAAKLTDGEVIVYCPDGSMSPKEAEVRVRYSPRANIEVLKSVPDSIVHDDINALERKHSALWSFEVFLAPEHVPKYAGRIAAECEEEFDLPNDVSAYHNTGIENVAVHALLEAIQQTNNDYRIVAQMMESMHKQGKRGLTTPDKWIEAFPDQLQSKLF
jgi:hypothetical protein